MSIIRFVREAFEELFPKKDMPAITVKYSGKFSPYNANVTYTKEELNFSLSKTWRQIDDSIKKGLIQSLLIKVYAKRNKDLKKSKTIALDLYDSFTKNIHKAIPKTETDPILEHHFNLVNDKFLNGILERPNLIWGKDSTRQLGVYSYQDDTIRISTIFNNPDDEEAMHLLQYVIYHEMLHKKFKYKTTNTRSHHHTKEFRQKESEFGNLKHLEERLGKYIRSYKARKSWAKRKNQLNEFTTKFKRSTLLKDQIIKEKNDNTVVLSNLQNEIQRDMYSKPKNKQFSLKRWFFGRF